ncbi:MAG: tRNA dihydrouridine synthase DusB [Propionibacteriaceae bacterium]|nr:tRNA dihydrouridine synthase DusB [Propionibacteriaceae bacterium]
MAGVTNAAFRTLCYEQGAGLAICEMVTAQSLVAGDNRSAQMMAFWDGEPVRSVQLYGTDPACLDVAIGIAIESLGAQHIDLNFGCPVPKVTRRGGGGVLAWKLDLMRAILRASVRSADRFGVPVTVKTRIGIDDDHTTFLDLLRVAQDEGVAAVCLHARTVAQAYSGAAHWDAIGQAVAAVDIPVLGNGDIWEAGDALAMIARTGCAGVEVGRGALGRPWLFHDLADALHGRPDTELPTLGQVCALVRRHAELLVRLMGERHGMADFRKHPAWYFKGFPLGGELRHALAMVSSLDELDALLAQLDPSVPFPAAELGRPRGRQGSPRTKVAMPYGWLDDRCGLDLDLSDAEGDVSGG